MAKLEMRNLDDFVAGALEARTKAKGVASGYRWQRSPRQRY
jgi:hypothetical protein